MSGKERTQRWRADSKPAGASTLLKPTRRRQSSYMKRRAHRLAYNGEHRLMIELGIV